MKQRKKTTSDKDRRMRNFYICIGLYFGCLPLCILFMMYLETFGDRTYVLQEFVSGIFASIYLFGAIYLLVPLAIAAISALKSRMRKKD